MFLKVDYKNSSGVVRDWLLAKYQVLNNCENGMYILGEDENCEIYYEIGNPGCGLFFDDIKFEMMKNAGYFLGGPIRYQGEGAVKITQKVKDELILEKEYFEEEKAGLSKRGFKLFMEPSLVRYYESSAGNDFSVKDYGSPYALEMAVRSLRRHYSELYNLFLIPENEVQNISVGTLLFSSADAKEILYNESLDLKIKDGFSTYGIRIMPTYIDSKLLRIVEK